MTRLSLPLGTSVLPLGSRESVTSVVPHPGLSPDLRPHGWRRRPKREGRCSLPWALPDLSDVPPHTDWSPYFHEEAHPVSLTPTPCGGPVLPCNPVMLVPTPSTESGRDPEGVEVQGLLPDRGLLDTDFTGTFLWLPVGCRTSDPSSWTVHPWSPIRGRKGSKETRVWGRRDGSGREGEVKTPATMSFLLFSPTLPPSPYLWFTPFLS